MKRNLDKLGDINFPNKNRSRRDGPNPSNKDYVIFLVDNFGNTDDDPTTPSFEEEDDTVSCPGINCDHKYDSDNIPVFDINFNDITTITLTDLITAGACYHCREQTAYGNIQLKQLAIMREALIELNNVIGMTTIKQTFAEQIIYFLLDLEPNPTELLHTIITGPPGVGKSHVIGIIAKLYLKMGYLKKDIIHNVRIDDLKADIVGGTAILTQKAINKSLGGILVIDEAYSLASADRIDSFSKEVIDTLNRNLTEHAGEFICIMAGYKDQIQRCLFNNNPGLSSRFRFRFNIDNYTSDELLKIFMGKIEKQKWSYVGSNDILAKFFNKNLKKFAHYGRDMESLLYYCKIANCNRILFSNADKFQITFSDLTNAYRRFLDNCSGDNQKEADVTSMYL